MGREFAAVVLELQRCTVLTSVSVLSSPVRNILKRKTSLQILNDLLYLLKENLPAVEDNFLIGPLLFFNPSLG